MNITIHGPVSSALTHLAAIGLAQIAEDAQLSHVRTWWSDGVPATATIQWHGNDDPGKVVHDHATRLATEASWVQATFVHQGRLTGVFSPRIKSPQSHAAWLRLASERQAWLDRPVGTPLDYRMIGAIGEPAFWLCDDPRGISDQGASRWEMKTRNSGEEFVQHRLAKLAKVVAARTPLEVRNGISGEVVIDELGEERPDSRTATGLQAPGIVDNALAWCALWGIAALPTTPTRGSISGCVGVDPKNEWTHPTQMVLPVFGEPVSPSAWRDVISTRWFSQAAFGSVADVVSGTSWLRAHRVVGLVRFPTRVIGSASAPERYLLPGTFEWFMT